MNVLQGNKLSLLSDIEELTFLITLICILTIIDKMRYLNTQ